jgi:hypothetical protein
VEQLLETPSFWQVFKRRWCRHPLMIRTERTAQMPAHDVCQVCGWREPVFASLPQSSRTWDSSRDSKRVTRDRRRRVALESQRLAIAARRATPGEPDAPRRRDPTRDNVVELKRANVG